MVAHRAMTTIERGAMQIAPTPAELNLGDLMRVGATLAKSGFFPDAKSEAQAVAKVIAGAELGIGPVASLRGINVIEGQLSLAANLVAALIKRARPLYDYRIIEASDARCEIAFFERGAESGRSTYTLDDARRANLASKTNWQRYPSDMLFSRAITRGARRFCADLFLGGVYTPEELEAAPLPEATLSSVAQEVQHGPEAASATNDDDARRRFWARATELGHVTPEGKLSKRRVHEALGVPAQDGALSPWADDLGWDRLLQLLEGGITVQQWTEPAPQADDILAPDELPFDAPAQPTMGGMLESAAIPRVDPADVRRHR